MTKIFHLPDFPSRYQIERQLGEGALGEVFLAIDLETNSKVVIKTLKQSITLFAHDAQIHIKRFYNEFAALKNCDHPNIIRVLDFCEYKQLLFFTMEYLEGKPLSSLIPKRPEEDDGFLEKPVGNETEEPVIPFNYPTIDEYISYLFQIVQGLYCVHKNGMIHRDLKPDNIFLTKDNKIKLLDFGLAKAEQSSVKLTIASNALGTPNYMPPEVLSSEPLDHLGDIYSFGILAFELLARELPYQHKSQLMLSYKHALADIPSAKAVNPEIPDWLDGVIKTCMQKEKKRRYQSVLEVIAIFLKNRPELSSDEDLKKRAAQLAGNKTLDKHEENLRADKRAVFKNSFKRLCSVFIMVMLFFVAWYSPIGNYSNVTLLRTLFAIRGPITPPKDVVIVAMDDLSYQNLGLSTRQPFPRKYIAQALQKIHETKPKIVIIDARLQKENIDDASDSALETAIGFGPTTLMKWEQANTALSEEYQGPENKLKFYNDPRFAKAALMEIEPYVPSSNGIVLNIGLHKKNGELLNTDNINEKIPIRAALDSVGIENLAEPNNYEYINFYGNSNKIPSISLYKILSGKYNFENKIVLLGQKSLSRTDVPGDYDVLPTSGSWNYYFGIEIQATIVGNLLDNSFIKRLPQKIENVFLGLISGFMFLFLLSKSPAQAIRYFSESLLGWFAITAWIFLHYNLLIPGVFLMLVSSFFVCAGIWFFYGNAKENRLIEVEELTKIKLRRD